MSPRKRLLPLDRGYTLMELMAVLALTAVLAVLAAPRISKGFQGAQLKTSVKQFAAAMRAARSVAVTERTRVIVDVEIEGRVYNFKLYTDRRNTAGAGLETGIEAAEGGGSSYVPPILREPFELPEGIYFSGFMIDDKTVRGFEKAFIEFFPRGNSTGGTVIIESDNGTAYGVSVNRVTGRVYIEPMS